MRLHDLLEAAEAASPTKLAVIDHDDARYDWATMAHAAREVATALKERGVGAGDRVVILLENAATMVAALYGCSMLGAVACPVNARLTEVELERILAHSGARAVCATVATGPAPRGHAEALAAEEVTLAVGPLAMAARDGDGEAAPEAVAILLYTSGTTGDPKGAMLTHAGFLATAEASRAVRDLGSEDLLYLALPMSHVFGLAMILASTKARACVRLEARFDVKRLYEALGQGVSVLSAVPQMHAHLFAYAREHGMARYAGGPLRYISSGGAPLDPAWKREAEAFYGLPLQNGYGMTETASGVSSTVNKLGDPDCSVGVPMLGSELRLDFEAPGGDAEAGVGEVEVKGVQVMLGYFRNPEATAAVMTEDGWFRTGDLGRFDEQGRLHLVGRSKELIIHSGFNVYPVEVEAALTEHPGVVLAAVVGRARDGNEEVLGFVTPRAGVTLDEAEIRAFLKERLAPYKVPARVIVAESLPAAPTGKILKAKLLSHFAHELG